MIGTSGSSGARGALLVVAGLLAGLWQAAANPSVDLRTELGSGAAIRSLSPAPGFTFAWSFRNDEIVVAIEAATTGWVGFGLGERGSGAMAGSDLLTCTGEGELIDGFATGFAAPVRDVIQDWTLVTSSEKLGNTTCVLRRRLDTGDSHEDRAIVRTGFATMLLFAWSSDGGDVVQYHGLNRYHLLVDLFGSDPMAQDLTPANGGATELLNEHHTISDAPYEYFDKCHNVSGAAIFGEDRSIVAIAPVLDPATVGYLHHFTVYGFEDERCDDDEAMGVILYVWGPGAPSMIAPSSVGIRLGSQGLRSLRVQTHFNNPSMTAEQVDNSGIQVYYTAVGSTRPIEMGVMQLGDPFVDLRDAQLPRGWSNVSFECSASTTSQFTSNIHIVAEALHMHNTGQMMSNELIRNGEVVRTTATDFFNFNFQGLVPEVYVVRPGDTLRTNCTYNTGTANVVWGFSSSDEMCIDYMMYYPRQAILDSEAGGCGLNHGGRLLHPNTAMATPADRHGFGDQLGLTSLATTTAPASAPAMSLSQPPGGSPTNTALVVGAAVAAVAAVAIALGCYVKREKIKPVFCGSTGPVYSKLGVEMGELGGADSDVDDGDDELILN